MKYNFEYIMQSIKSFESKKRYLHTLGVAYEAYKLGLLFMPEKAEKLFTTGLLHDITKDFKTDWHLNFCQEAGIKIDYDNLVPKLLHSKTGCEFSKRIFSDELIDDEIYSGILYHTTGRENMTVFEALVYLADYIEPGRTFVDCVLLRKYFYDNLKGCICEKDRLEVLRRTIVFSFDLTIKNLLEERKAIDEDTIKARNYFLKNETFCKKAEE